ncbi:MAG TPA: hypothetical protein PK156_26430 [Polyangium sp.]|nr:hypothetical protein [Polyangium sp.]
MSFDSRANLVINIATATYRDPIVELLAAQLGEHDIELDSENLKHTVDGFFEDSSRGRGTCACFVRRERPEKPDSRHAKRTE